ncbi:olfactory receptor 7A40-like [Lampetra fluviatilis]
MSTWLLDLVSNAVDKQLRAMENGSSSSSSIALNTLDISREASWLIFSALHLCFLFILVSNFVILIAVVLSRELHKPMHMFLCYLALADIVGSATIIPKQLQILSSGCSDISYVGCMGQAFCINLFVIAESLSLSFISTDRYLAICKPLRYHAILPLKRSVYIIILAWLSTVAACVAILVYTLSLQMKEGDRSIDSAFCYSIYIVNLSVSDTTRTRMLLSACIVMFLGLPPLILMYTFIRVCLEFAKASSPALSKKAKETLVTQLLVTSIYFISLLTIIVRGRLNRSSGSGTGNKNVNYVIELSILVPMAVNVIIFGLRITELRKAIANLFQRGFKILPIDVKSKKIGLQTRHG